MVDTVQFNPLRPDLGSEAIQLQNELINLIEYTQNLQSVIPATSGAETIGSAPITGLTGTTVYAQMSSLASSIKKVRVSLNDDTATSVAVSDNAGIVTGFTDVTNTQFMVYSRPSGTPITTTMVLGTAVNNSNNVVLTGATGTDGFLNVSSNGGNFYVENRLGSTQTVEIIFLGG